MDDWFYCVFTSLANRAFMPGADASIRMVYTRMFHITVGSIKFKCYFTARAMNV